MGVFRLPTSHNAAYGEQGHIVKCLGIMTNVHGLETDTGLKSHGYGKPRALIGHVEHPQRPDFEISGARIDRGPHRGLIQAPSAPTSVMTEIGSPHNLLEKMGCAHRMETPR